MTLDELRAAHPEFGFIAYAAFSPGAIVEVIRDGTVLEQVKADTFAAAVEDAVNFALIVLAREAEIAREMLVESERLFGAGRVGNDVAVSSIFD